MDTDSPSVQSKRARYMYVSHGAQLCAVLHEAGVNLCLLPALLAALPETEVSIQHLCQAELLARCAKQTLRCTYRTMLTAHARAGGMANGGAGCGPSEMPGGAEVGSPMVVMSDSDGSSDDSEQESAEEGAGEGASDDDGGLDDEADALEWSAQSMSPGESCRLTVDARCCNTPHAHRKSPHCSNDGLRRHFTISSSVCCGECNGSEQ